MVVADCRFIVTFTAIHARKTCLCTAVARLLLWQRVHLVQLTLKVIWWIQWGNEWQSCLALTPPVAWIRVMWTKIPDIGWALLESTAYYSYLFLFFPWSIWIPYFWLAKKVRSREFNGFLGTFSKSNFEGVFPTFEQNLSTIQINFLRHSNLTCQLSLISYFFIYLFIADFTSRASQYRTSVLIRQL